MFNYKCLFESPFVNELVKIIMQIFFVITFLSLFFFLYVVKVEKEIFISQMNYIVDNIYNQLSFASNMVLPLEVKRDLDTEMMSYIAGVNIPSTSYEDIHTTNQNVIQMTVNIVTNFAVLFAACLMGLFVLHVCIDMTHHTVQNLIVLGCIALTEFLFLNLVTRNYIAADPNHVKLYFARQVKSYAQQQQQNIFGTFQGLL